MSVWERIANIAYNAYVAFDPDGRVIAWNVRAEELFGLSREQAVGRRLAETIIPERHRKAHADGLRRFRETGESPLIGERMQLSLVHSDGSEFPAEMTIAPFAEPSGYAFWAVIADRSELRASERERERLLAELRKALSGTEQRFAVTLDALAEGVTIRGAGDRLLYANKAALDSLGLASVEELRSVDPQVLMERTHSATTPDGRPLRVEDTPSARVLRGEQPEPLLLRAVERDSGRERWSLLKTAPIRNPDGEVEAAVTIIEDHTAEHRRALRLELLARAGQLLASSLDYEQTLRNVAGLAVPQIADWCAVDLLDDSAQRAPVVIAHSDPRKVAIAERLREHEPRRLDFKRGLGRAMYKGDPQVFNDITDAMLVRMAIDEQHLELLRRIGLKAAMIVPLRARNRTIGALTLFNSESARNFDEEDLAFAGQVAERAALAVENARLYRQRSELAHMLQRSLLPDALPQIPEWEVAAHYRPAGEDSEVGGDFYDVWAVEDDWLVLIGDVTGKGVGAASLTSLARHSARTASEFDPRPAHVLARIDKALRRRPDISLCTALCLRIRANKVELAAAGHPLPLLISRGRVRELGRYGLLLGAEDRVSRPEDTIEMQPGDALVAITDGVTDAVGAGGERFGAERLAARLEELHAGAPAGIIDGLMSSVEAFQSGRQADDRAVLVARFGGRAQEPGAMSREPAGASRERAGDPVMAAAARGAVIA